MNHPMYRDRDATTAYASWKRDESIFFRQAHELLSSHGVSSGYIAALVQQFHIMKNIERNGNVVIDIDGKNWESEISEKTISGMKIEDIKIPFTAGAIIDQAITGGYLLFSLEKDMFTMIIFVNEGDYNKSLNDSTVDITSPYDYPLEDQDGGIVSVRIPVGDVLHENLRGKSIANKYVYMALSILMYISAFRNDSTRVKSLNLKATKASKKKSIPKHKINKILLYQHEVEHSASGGSRGTLTKAHIVRGHWRNQWYSKEGRHKPKWLDPYFKGKGKEEISKIYKVS